MLTVNTRAGLFIKDKRRPTITCIIVYTMIISIVIIISSIILRTTFYTSVVAIIVSMSVIPS